MLRVNTAMIIIVLVLSGHGADSSRIKTNTALLGESSRQQVQQGRQATEAVQSAQSASSEFNPQAVIAETDTVQASPAVELHDAVTSILLIDDNAKFENGGDAAFSKLRRACLHARQAGTLEFFDQESSHAPAVWKFLEDFTKKHRTHVRLVSEVVNVLMKSKPWAAAVEDFKELEVLFHKSQDDQATAPVQSVGSASSDLNLQTLAADDDTVQASPVGPRLEEHWQQRHLEKLEKLREELHDALTSTLGMDNIVKFENKGHAAFQKLRKVCLHIKQAEALEVLDETSTVASSVWKFLIQFSKKQRNYVRQVAEVVNFLMKSAPWASAFNEFIDRVKAELSAKAQEAFGIQPEVSEEAQDVEAVSLNDDGDAALGEETALLKQLAEKFVPSEATEDYPAGYADYIAVTKILDAHFQGLNCGVVRMDEDPTKFLATIEGFKPKHSYPFTLSGRNPQKLHGVVLSDERAQDYKDVVSVATSAVERVIEIDEELNAGTEAAMYMTMNPSRLTFYLRKLKQLGKGRWGQGNPSIAFIVYHVVPHKTQYVYKNTATGERVNYFDRAAFEAGEVQPVISSNGRVRTKDERVVIIDSLVGSPAHKGAATALLISQVLSAFWQPVQRGEEVPMFALLDPISDGLIKYYEKLCFQKYMDVYRVEERKRNHAGAMPRKGLRWILTWDRVMRCFSNPDFVRAVLRVA